MLKMRKATENQENTRTLITEYYSPRNKVNDLVFEQRPRPHFTPFLQETPMKPSELPSYPFPRRMLPFQSPAPYHRDRGGPPWPPLHSPGPIHSSGFVPSSPTNMSSIVNRFHLMPRGRLGPQQHQHHQPPGFYCSSGFAAVSPTNTCTTANRCPSGFQPVFPQFIKDLSNRSPPSHIRRDQGTESRDTLTNSGSQKLTAERQESNKAQTSDMMGSIHTIELHRPHMTPSFNNREIQEVCPLPPSDSEHCGNSQWPHSPVTPCQDQQRKQTSSSGNPILVMDLNCSSQKRHWDSEDCNDSAKKPCLPGINSSKAQTPKPTVGDSVSTSLLSQPSAVLELSPKTTDNHLCTEPAFKPTQSSCASLSPKTCVNRRPSMGAKQAYINSTQNQTLEIIQLRSPSKADEESLKKRSEDNDKWDKSSFLLSSEVPQKDTGSSPHVQVGSHNSSHTHRSSSVLPIKTLSKSDHAEKSGKSDGNISKTNSGSLSCRTVERNKPARPRRPVAIPYDIDKLFTPDPMTYVVGSGHKTAKPKVERVKSTTSEKTCSSSSVTSSSTPLTRSSSCKTSFPHSVDTKVSALSSAHQPEIFLPTITLERVKLEKLKYNSSKTSELKNSPMTSSGRQFKDESVKSDVKCTSLLPNNVRPCALEPGTTTSIYRCFHTPLLERQASEGCRKPMNEEDPIDVELDLGLSFALDLDLTQSSHSSEEEQLLSLQEMMERVTKPPDTPEKGAFSEPSTPTHHGCQSKTQPTPSNTKSGSYKNNLDQMLKEINTNKRAKEIETQLLTACKEDLLRIAEYEEAEENREAGVSTEQQEFLQRYSLMSNAIREVPPGETVFNLERFGRIFDQDVLQLRRCMVNPQGTAQKTILWSSPAQLSLHVNIGLFQEAYDCRSPCPTQVTRFLFKMMSVHRERMLSEKILQTLCDIACTAAYEIVKNGSQLFKVWVPSLADVALVLMNMGVAFVTLFPFENLQPPFTEGDLLEDIYIKSESPSSNKEQSPFPEHNCNNILKYLSYCMGLCPRAYSDDELLLLLTVVGRVGLDPWLILQSNVELYPLQYKIVNNIRDWDSMLARICLALTDLTDDHHNMCLLVQLLPDSTRGKQLRRHLSLSMISKLLDGNCTYRPTEKEFQLSELRTYLPRMQPSTLLRGMLSSSSRSRRDEDMAILDQQTYYLCYSLLTLANEASNFQFFPAHQKKQLLFLCSELETHVKCDIRESEKCLYRSKVKDLVARIYTKWQMLLQRTRPLHGKLYDYWQPLPVDTLTSSQDELEMDISDDGERPVMEEEDDEEKTNETKGVITVSEKEDGEDTVDYTNKTGDDMMPEEMEGDCAMDDTKETEEATMTVNGEFNGEMSEMEPPVHEQIEAGNIERAEVETESG